MSTNVIPSFILNINEKVMLRAFIQGTQVSEKDSQEPIWTTEALDGLQDILEDKTEDLPSHLVQDLFCIFADLIIRKDLGRSNTEFTRIMVKFLHHLVTLIDWTAKRKVRRKPGPKPSPHLSLEVHPQSQETEETAHTIQTP